MIKSVFCFFCFLLTLGFSSSDNDRNAISELSEFDPAFGLSENLPDYIASARVVFDLDATLIQQCSVADIREGDFSFSWQYCGKNYTHVIFKYVPHLFMQIAEWGLKIDIFSAGVEARNLVAFVAIKQFIVEKFALSLERVNDIFSDTLIYSRQHLKTETYLVRGPMGCLQEGQQYKKDLSILYNADLDCQIDVENAILVDDNPDYICDGQVAFVDMNDILREAIPFSDANAELWPYIPLNSLLPNSRISDLSMVYVAGMIQNVLCEMIENPQPFRAALESVLSRFPAEGGGRRNHVIDISDEGREALAGMSPSYVRQSFEHGSAS